MNNNLEISAKNVANDLGVVPHIFRYGERIAIVQTLKRILVSFCSVICTEYRWCKGFRTEVVQRRGGTRVVSFCSLICTEYRWCRGFRTEVIQRRGDTRVVSFCCVSWVVSSMLLDLHRYDLAYFVHRRIADSAQKCAVLWYMTRRQEVYTKCINMSVGPFHIVSRSIRVRSVTSRCNVFQICLF